MSNHIELGLEEAAKTLHAFLTNKENTSQLSEAIKQLVLTFREGKNVFSCGNGGSMCDAMHFAEELTGRYRKNRKPLPATAIADPSHLSCVANDFGYDEVFSRYIEAWGNEGDCLLAISTSGNSKNVILATEIAKQKSLKVIGLLGKGGGKLKSLVDYPIIVDSNTTDRIQEIHIKTIHLMIEGIERELFPENYQT